jgi:hypothetical protein
MIPHQKYLEADRRERWSSGANLTKIRANHGDASAGKAPTSVTDLEIAVKHVEA